MPPSPHDAAAPAGHPNAYTARINRVVDHISTHLAETLDLQTLAGVAHFSPWHFHRVFQGMTGETLADCVRRLRLEAAAQRLLGTPPLPALHVAIDAGFASAEVFSRAFRLHFGMTPTEWRRGRWRDWAAHHQHELSKIHQAVHKNYQDLLPTLFKDQGHWPVGPVKPFEQEAEMDVTIKHLPAVRLAYMRYTGPYGTPGIPQLWERFARWCGSAGLMEPRRRMYGLPQDNPEITPADKCRYDCCIEVDDSFRPQGEVGVETFGGGRYACARYQGTGADIHKAWMQMYSGWLPASGYVADDKPCVELYEEDFVLDPATGAFNCLLCVPVKAL